MPVTPTKENIQMATMSSHWQYQMPQGPQTGRLDINALISPPDAVYDSFSSTASARILPMSSMALKPSRQSTHDVPPSPPISVESTSPDQKAEHTISPVPSLSVPVKDPILFPTADTSSSSSRRPVPLFGPQETVVAEQEAERIIHDHLRAKGPLNETAGPTNDDYRLALRFKSSVLQRWLANPRGWLTQERALLAADRAASYRARPAPSHHYRQFTKPQQMRPQQPKPQAIQSNSNRVQKPVKGKEPRVTKQPANRPIRTTPGAARSTNRVSSTPEPRVRTVAPNREDKDFNSLPDYCPPLSSLGNRSLKVDWKGNPLDLSKDPYAHLLHPEEVKLAANLRLDCATYLTSKRRIFISRRDCYKRSTPKPFRKTDAQQACKIDVNKASKLWAAYDGVGWLDDRLVRHL